MQTIYPTDMEGTKWFKLGQNLKEAVTTAGTTIPGDLKAIDSSDTEGTKWYKLGRWLSLIAGGGSNVPLTGVDYYTPLELLASRNIVNSDAGKWLFNTGVAKTLTLTGRGQLGSFTRFDGRNPQGPVTFSKITGGEFYFKPVTAPFTFPRWSFSNGVGFETGITVSEDTYVGWDASPYTGGATTIQFDGGTVYDQRTAGSHLLTAGLHTIRGGGSADNGYLSWFKAVSMDVVTPGPMLVGQSLQGFQAGASAITIDAGGNTLVAPGLTTKGPGSWFEIKKIGDNLYHAHGDLS